MTDGFVPLDGNAAAGPLRDLFAADVTSAIVLCAGCGREGPVAELRLYGGAGLVLRCRGCDAVNIRLVDTGRTRHLDMSGVRRLTICVD